MRRKDAIREKNPHSYAARVFRESSISVVSNIVQSNSTWRRVFKVFFLIVCLTGFVYQSGKFVMSFLRYPAVMDVDIQRHEKLMMPAFTFCNNNGLKRSIFCQKFPEKCEEADEEFCKQYGSYCGINKTLIPKKQYHDPRNYVSQAQEDILHFNDALDKFLVRNAYLCHVRNVTGPHFRLKSFKYPQLIPCYSWNERVDSELEPQMTSENTIIRFPKCKLVFDVEEDEVFTPGEEAGVLFDIHSPFDAVNLFETGLLLKPGKTYMIYISMEMEILLESPYETDCLNYEKLWKENNRSGPRTKKMCIDKCLQEYSMKCYNCVIPLLIYPTKEKLCKVEDLWEMDCKRNLIEECTHCKDSCNQIKYKYKVQERTNMKFDPDWLEEIEDIDKKIIVEVYIDSNEVIVWRHTPKYMLVEVFSTVGGFVGIWLGMSLLDVTDIFEGIFRVIRHSLRRKR